MLFSATIVSSVLWSLTTLVYAAIAMAVILLVKTLTIPYTAGNIPPFPARPYPILGHLPYLTKGSREKFLEFRKTAGDIFSLYFGSHLFIVVNGPRLVKEVLVRHSDTMSARAPQPYVDQGDFGVVFANGALWKEQRTVSIAILRSFGMGKSSLACKISEEISVYLDTLAALEGQPKDVRTLTSTSLSNVICSIIVGRRFDYEDPLFKNFVEKFARQIAAFDTAALVLIWPWLRYIPGNFLGAKTLNTCIQELRTEFCDKFIEMAEKENGEDAAPTFITSYLKEMEQAKRQGKHTTLSKEQLRVTLQQIFIAGTDTTATTIMWTILYLLNFPEIQNKMYEEIVSVTGPDRAPDMQDKVKLPYTNAVIMESQRLGNITPLSAPHCCSGDTVVEGYTIPAGAIIMPSLDSVLWDADTWEEPLKFKPERFLDESGNMFKPDAFIPFSIGPRACMGEALANMELFLYTTSLIKRFELQPSTPGQPPARQYTEGGVSAPSAFQLRFVERATN